MSDLTKRNFMPWIIFILAATFYLYEFCLQVSPGVMTHDMMADLHINAVGLGVMSAFYFYAYAPMQIPAGLLYDRFGPRRLITIAILVCALGAFLFSLTTNVAMASAGRFFMGIGSAFSFIGVLVLVAHWFKPSYFALLAGVAQLMSSIGAMVGETPLALSVTHLGWRHTMMWLAGIGVILSFLVWTIVRDYPDGHPRAERKVHENEFQKLKKILAKPQTWYVGLYNFFLWGPIVAFAALWGVPYLMQLYQVNVAVASSAVSMIWLGIGISSPLFGWWSDWLGSRKTPLEISAGIGVVTTLLILYMPNISFPLMYVLLFFFGVAAAGQSLSFAVVKENNHQHDVGTASGFNNMATVIGGAIFQPLIGYLLARAWDGKMLHSIPLYSVSAYKQALIVIPVCYIIAFILITFFIRETHCHPVEDYS